MPFQSGNITIAADGLNIIAEVGSRLLSAGWSQAGYQYSKTYNGRTMTVDLIGTSWLTSTPYILINGIAAYFPCFALVAGGSIELATSISADGLFYMRVAGPDAGFTGAYDATLGSPRAFAAITTITPADDNDNVLDSLQVAIRSHTNSNPTFAGVTVTQKNGPSGTANASAELMCVRPAVQDVASIGDLPPTTRAGSGFFGSRYVVVDNTWGLRGTLDNIAFASESYTLAGDNATSQFTPGGTYTRGGKDYIVEAPCGAPSATGVISYSPLGVATAASTNQAQAKSQGNLSGPRIFVRST
jgi:hypothetical protein